MTRAEFSAKFPHATESVIRLNCSDAITRTCPAPSPTRERLAAVKEQPAARKPSKRVLSPRTRNGGTITEAAYWGMLRSGLRRTFLWWKPAQTALRAARIPYNGPNGQKWAFICADCNGRHLRKNVHIDHIEPAGALTSYEHVGEFVRRLTPESPAAYAIRCHACHQAKTNAERGIAPESQGSLPLET